jgi:uncharacterized membrane protein YadS
MIAVIPLVGVLYASDRRSHTEEGVSWLGMIPWFIIGFALMSSFRTIGDLGDKAFGVLEPQAWAALTGFLRSAAEECLLVAMAAVGLTSLFAGMRSIGLKPFALGLFAALLIGIVSLASISLFAEPMMAMISID